MALIVNNNIPALNSYNAVNATTGSLQKSIQKLSTGLRINSAADDAAGLAISEKMRAQIRGLDRAVANSQDGISMIQTAEGALNETHSILQRMRELSVQAANDTLTQQDRAYIQLEIDQLREEVTRIGNTTQFNKKKLLDGSAAVLWSSDRLTTKAIINGGLRQIDQFGQKNSLEGNFKIVINAKPGDAEIKKTDIFKLKHGVTTTAYEDPNFISKTSGTALPRGNYRISATATPAAAAATWVDGTGAFGVGGPTVGGLAAMGTGLSGNVLIEVIENDGTNITYKVTGSFIDLAGGESSATETIKGTAGALTLTSGVLNGLEITAEAAHSVGSKAVMHITTDSTGADGTIDITDAAYGSTPDGVSPRLLQYNVTDANVAGKQLKITNFFIDKSTNTASQGTISFALGGGYTSANALAATGAPALQLPGMSSPYTPADGTLAVFSAAQVGDVAAGNNRLYDLEKFWDAQGRFMLVDPQTLTLTQGDGKTATVTLYANDTLNDVARKLNDAISAGLGQGQYVGGLINNFVNYVGAGNPASSLENTPGTMVIRSALPGAAGKISFAGDEDLIKALSMNVIQKATETDYTVTVTNAHTNEVVVNAERITGNRLIGKVNPNVDVEFALNAGFGVASWNASLGTFAFTAPVASETYLHLADNTTVFQIGATEGEDMGINIGDMRSHALGLNSVLVTDREAAARSITIIDNALDKVSTQRAKLGAYQNRLEHTITNLTVAGENLTAAESRIRDTDMAKEMMNFTKLQIMLQAGTSMLAQANALPQNVLSLIR
ncbi:MAG: flagellin [Synergistaceae bacterium]|jgi:flagellin|nr:flagellin [Synergistaceae bacterium]